MELNRRYLDTCTTLVSVILVLTALAVDDVNGYPSGAPNDVNTCTTLLPNHGVIAQATEMPYDVIVDGAPNTGSYDVTKNHTVTISGKSGTNFRGFILQARQYTSSSNFTTCGSFTTSSDAKATCQVVGGATVTHVTNNDKTSIQVLWIAPSNATGTVQFRGTIVQVKVTFWEFAPTSSPTPETTVEPPIAIDISGCGETKGCYFSNCADPSDPNQCEYGVTWSAAGPDGTAFELFASATFSASPYVAFGLSKDTLMSDDSVTDCIYSPDTGAVSVQMSWNTGHSNSVLVDKTLSLVNGSMSGSFSNGMLICRFTRLTYPPSTNTRSKRQTNTDQVLYPGSDLYHILIAKGPASSGMKAQHSYEPAASATKVNFTQFINVSDKQGLS